MEEAAGGMELDGKLGWREGSAAGATFLSSLVEPGDHHRTPQQGGAGSKHIHCASRFLMN